MHLKCFYIFATFNLLLKKIHCVQMNLTIFSSVSFMILIVVINPFSVNPTLTKCLTVFDQFVGLVLKGIS